MLTMQTVRPDTCHANQYITFCRNEILYNTSERTALQTTALTMYTKSANEKPKQRKKVLGAYIQLHPVQEQ